MVGRRRAPPHPDLLVVAVEAAAVRLVRLALASVKREDMLRRARMMTMMLVLLLCRLDRILRPRQRHDFVSARCTSVCNVCLG